jgi:dTMP kinase
MPESRVSASPSELSALSALRGKFLSFEGLDGCGKSTQARLVAERLEAAGLTVVRTREPGGTDIGKALRRVVLDPGNEKLVPNVELLIFLADRIQHLAELIRPALERGDTVVCDRFHDATVAYQQHGRGLSLAAFQQLIALEIRPLPDLTFWLDLDVTAAHARLVSRYKEVAAESERTGRHGGHLELVKEARLEGEDRAFHERVRAGYARIAEAEPNRVVRVEGTRPIAAVHAEIWERLVGRFAQKPGAPGPDSR